MRTIGFRTNILFAIAAAFGLVASLGRPWYGPPAEPTGAQMEDLFTGIGRAFTQSGGTTGWAALESADGLLAGLAGATVALLVLSLVPAIQRHAQALARWSALAALGVVVVKLIDTPDAAALAQARSGLLIGLGAAVVLAGSTLTAANAPVRRRATPAPSYTPPPAPVYDADASYGPPQF